MVELTSRAVQTAHASGLDMESVLADSVKSPTVAYISNFEDSCPSDDSSSTDVTRTLFHKSKVLAGAKEASIDLQNVISRSGIESNLLEICFTAWYLTFLRLQCDGDFRLSWTVRRVCDDALISGKHSIRLSNSWQNDNCASTSLATEISDVIKSSLQPQQGPFAAPDHYLSLSGPAGGDEDSTPSCEDFDGFSLQTVSVDLRLSDNRLWTRFRAPTHHLENLIEDSFINMLKLVLTAQSGNQLNAYRLTQWDRIQISKWNATLPPLITSSIYTLVSKKAKEIPNKHAIDSWDGTLTYGDADLWSDQLAHRLLRLGVSAGMVVPVCFEKSRWTVVAVLAVMKTGATFVLLDPSQPRSRLQVIATEVNAQLVISSLMQEAKVTDLVPGCTVVSISAGSFNHDENSMVKALPVVDPSASMYIIFTSGSTGKPKGVIVSHENYLSGAIPRGHAVGFTSRSRVIDFAAYAFDVSIDSMLITMMNGGTLCIPSDEDRVNDLNGVVRRMGITMVNITPSVARILEDDVITALSEVGIGGEPVSARDVEQWGKKARVVMGYGPSECTVGCTINSSAASGRNYVDLGNPTGAALWIVDPTNHTRLMPVGAIGELVIEGPVVGQGYLNDPAKTAASFISDPDWLSMVGRKGRVYLTGDLAKYDPDGSGRLLFAGRKDTQVKLRGQRVELGEVEYHLAAQLPSDVTITAEVVSRELGRQQNLVAFISEKSIAAIRSDDLSITTFTAELSSRLAAVRETLLASIPKYMVPAAFIPITFTPSTASAKTDRKRLRALALQDEFWEACRSTVKPSKTALSRDLSPAEQGLAKLWSTILRRPVDSIGLHDNFFSLGGDSVAAMRLVALARKGDMTLTMTSIFSASDLATMAVSASNGQASQDLPIDAFSLLNNSWSATEAREEAAKACGVAASIVQDVYPSTPLQETLVAFSVRSNSAFFAQRVFLLSDRIHVPAFQDAWSSTVQQSPILRARVIDLPDRGLAQVIIDEGISWKKASDLEAYLQEDMANRMDLGTPLSRYGCVQEQSSGRTYVIWSAHHALYDAWSTDLIIQRLRSNFLRQDVSPVFDMKPLVRYLNNPDRSSSLDYWKDQLRGANGPQFPPVPSRNYLSKPDCLLTRDIALSNLSKQSFTLSTLIRGAWALTIAQYINSTDIVIGETLTGRNLPLANADLIEAPMITTVPVRINVDKRLTTQQYLSMIQQDAIARIPHEHTGLQYVRRVSDDAQLACEIKTGLIIHPQDGDGLGSEIIPGTGITIINNRSPAEETLEFNSYPLMLVCSLKPAGLKVHASFDVNLVSEEDMRRVLASFETALKQLSSQPDLPIEELCLLTEDCLTQIWDWNADGPAAICSESSRLLLNPIGGVCATVSWLTIPGDPSKLAPIGAVGDLYIEGPLAASDTIETPQWLRQGHGSRKGRSGLLHHTGRLAKYDPSGKIVLCDQSLDANLAKSELTNHVTATTEDLKRIAGPRSPSVLNDKEEQLREAWANLLHLKLASITCEDSFFALGGDSILAMKLVLTLRKASLRLTVGDIFRNMHLKDMAGAMQIESSVGSMTHPPYQPYSMLEVTQVDEFINTVVRPRLAEQTWKVSDVFPVTDSQIRDIEATVRVPRSSVQYNLFKFDYRIDESRIRRACDTLVAHHDLLRTVFVRHDQSYLQVVIDAVKTPFQRYDTKDDIEEFVDMHCQKDVEVDMTLGALFVKFFLVNADDGSSCLIFRLSHAQYDGVSLPEMMRQLNMTFREQPLPVAPSFASYVNHGTKVSRDYSIKFWRATLTDAKITALRPSVPVTKSVESIFLTRSIDMTRKPKDITNSTLLTAAWAILLARSTSSIDITFGGISSGRNTTQAEVEQIVGPCYQFVPIRVCFASGLTMTELLADIQAQYAARLPHEALGLSAITGHCTDWAKGTDFDSVVHHQDLDDFDGMPFGNGFCKVSVLNPHAETSDQWRVMTYPDGSGRMTLGILGAASWEHFVEETLDELMKTMAEIMDAPSRQFEVLPVAGGLTG